MKDKNASGIVYGILLSILAGVIFILAFPSYGGLWFLAPFAVIPMIVAQYRFLPHRQSGLAMGITWFVYWLALAYQGTRQLMYPWFCIPIALIMGAFGFFLGSFDRTFNERTSFRFFLLTMPAVWTGWDFLLSSNPITATEGQIYYLLAPVPALYQPVSLFGSPAFEFVILMFGASLGLAAIRIMDARHAPEAANGIPPAILKQVLAWGIGLTLVWVIAGFSIFAYSQCLTRPTARVAAIQIGTGTGFSPVGVGHFTHETKEVYERLSRGAAKEGAKLLVWPELGMDFDPRVTNPDWIPSLARETGSYIQGSWYMTDPDMTQHNMAGLWSPKGELLGIYNKQNPVIIAGEWYNQKPVFEVFDLPFGRMGMIICFDFTFYDISRTLADKGAQMITASVGNWYDVAAIRIPTAQFRAVENGVSFLKGELIAASAMIAPNGVVIAKSDPPTEEGESRFLIADLPLGGDGTLYSHIGDVFGWLCLVGLLVRAFFEFRMRKSSSHRV
ncbi:MAG: nitrilase-related carbon-nitrogen hydrolase [Dehalococcoidia bacterium]